MHIILKITATRRFATKPALFAAARQSKLLVSELAQPKTHVDVSAAPIAVQGEPASRRACARDVLREP